MASVRQTEEALERFFNSPTADQALQDLGVTEEQFFGGLAMALGRRFAGQDGGRQISEKLQSIARERGVTPNAGDRQGRGRAFSAGLQALDTLPRLGINQFNDLSRVFDSTAEVNARQDAAAQRQQQQLQQAQQAGARAGQQNISGPEQFQQNIQEINSRRRQAEELRKQARQTDNRANKRSLMQRASTLEREIARFEETNQALQSQGRAQGENLIQGNLNQLLQGERAAFAPERPETLQELNRLTGRANEAITQGLAESEIGAQATQLINEQLVSALEGNLPVNPALRRQFERQEEQLKANLRRQLGPGFETTSAGIEALSQFQQTKGDVFETARRQDINSLSAIAAAREQQEMQRGALGISVNQLNQSAEGLQLQREAQRLQEIASMEQLVQGRISFDTQQKIANIQAEAQKFSARASAGATISAANIAAQTQRRAQDIGAEQFAQSFGLEAAIAEQDLGLRREESEFSRGLQLGQFQAGIQNQGFNQSLALNNEIRTNAFADRQLKGMDFNLIAGLSDFGNIPTQGSGDQLSMGALSGLSDQRNAQLNANIATASNNTALLGSMFQSVGMVAGAL